MKTRKKKKLNIKKIVIFIIFLICIFYLIKKSNFNLSNNIITSNIQSNNDNSGYEIIKPYFDTL